VSYNKGEFIMWKEEYSMNMRGIELQMLPQVAWQIILWNKPRGVDSSLHELALKAETYLHNLFDGANVTYNNKQTVEEV